MTIWVYLQTSPLLGLTLTLLAYLAGEWLWLRSGRNVFLQPVLVAIVALVVLLRATGTPYERYFEGAQFVHFLLGPATVALAIPLVRNVDLIRRTFIPVAIALVTGAITSVVSVVLLARAFGAAPIVVRSLAPKSITTPIAMGISEHIGGLPSLTAALVVLSGVTGAVAATIVFRGDRNWAARGFGIGLASHGIGTARALQLDISAGAFASLALGLNAVVSSLLIPPLVALLLR